MMSKQKHDLTNKEAKNILAPLGIITCIIAGIGNACFHIGGGIDVLNLSVGI